MAIVGENVHSKRLKDNSLDIKTKYKSGDSIIYRDFLSDEKADVEGAIILEKDYYLHDRIIGKLYDFDPRITYTYLLKGELDNTSKCPNCGYEAKNKEFLNGCPYCRTNYNINYYDSSLGTKYHYDQIIHTNIYKIITLIIDLLISFGISYFYVSTTSRTFNSMDIGKILLYTFLIGLILYYVFYIADAYVVLLPIKRYKDKQNLKQQEFWKKMEEKEVNKNDFFNNLNYELDKYYYKGSNKIVDYNIIDYLEFNDVSTSKNTEVEVLIKLRLVKLDNNKIVTDTDTEKFRFRKINTKKKDLKGGTNMIDCHNCGASINVEERVCEYCHSEINYLQQWYLVK